MTADLLAAQMLLPLLLAAQAAPAPEPDRVVRRDYGSKPLQIPNQIAPAVMGYMVCLQLRWGDAREEERKNQKLEIETPASMRTALTRAVANCVNYRAMAADLASGLVRRSNPKASPADLALVDQTLTAMDGFFVTQIEDVEARLAQSAVGGGAKSTGQ